MATQQLANASEVIAKLVGVAPPVTPNILRGDTRLTGLWLNRPYEGYVGPMSEHVVAATFVGTGEAVARIDGKRIASRNLPGAITLAPRGHSGNWHITGEIWVSNVYIGHERLLGCGDQIAEGRQFELFDLVSQPDPTLFAIMKLICDEMDHPAHCSSVFIEHALDLLCYQLIRSHSTLDFSGLKPQRGLAHWQVQRVVNYIRENVGADISLQDLSDVIGMSRYHFCSAFREATGSTPHEYLTRVRMKTACNLLNDHRIPIGSVGAMVGYHTPSAFSAAFHKAMGVTPRQFRRES